MVCGLRCKEDRPDVIRVRHHAHIDRVVSTHQALTDLGAIPNDLNPGPVPKVNTILVGFVTCQWMLPYYGNYLFGATSAD